MPVPELGQGVTQLGFLIYPTYRLEVIGIIAVTLALLWLVLYRTSIGLVVRAGIEDPRMVGILGINVRRTFLLVFAIGVVAAGFAGMIYAPIIAVTPDMGDTFLVESFVVIVIGGLGSFPGAVVGGLIAGEIVSITSAFNSAYSEVMLYAADGAAAGGAPARPVRHRGPGMSAVCGGCSRGGGARRPRPPRDEVGMASADHDERTPRLVDHHKGDALAIAHTRAAHR